MNRGMRSALAFLVLALALCSAGLPAGFTLSADDMRTIEDTLHSLDSNVTLKDRRSLEEAREIAAFFEQVEGWYAAKADAPQGRDLAKATFGHAGAIAQAVEAGNFDAAQESVALLTRSCKRCHDLYKGK